MQAGQDPRLPPHFDRIEAALTAVLGEKVLTRDLGGTAGTKASTQAIVDKLKNT